MKDKFGDLFTTKAKILGHGVNTQGVMGAGIAKTFKREFTNNYRAYNLMCHAATGPLAPGEAFLHESDPYLIMNFASQRMTGKDARYPWLFSSLYDGAVRLLVYPELAEKYGTTIAIPEIGCGIGGLTYRKVARLIHSVESCLDNQVEFEVWHYGDV